MRQFPDCLPCYARAIVSTVEAASADEETAYRVMQDTFSLIGATSPSKCPGENFSPILLRAHHLLGNEDPYQAIRSDSNLQAHSWLPQMQGLVDAAEDPLQMAIRISALGNIMDAAIPDHDLDASMARVDTASFARYDYAEFQEVLDNASRVLVIGDNSGEIVLDRVLLKLLRHRGKQVTYSVKAGPILNDATWSDVTEAGIAELAQVVDTGSSYLGVVEGHYSEAFRKVLEGSDLVISKGMMNFGCLEGQPLAGEKTFFLLLIKCAPMARYLKVPPMAPVLIRNRIKGCAG